MDECIERKPNIGRDTGKQGGNVACGGGKEENT